MTIPAKIDTHRVREALLGLATRQFTRGGWFAVQEKAIRAAAGVSNGSLRHFFRDGKVDLAAGVYLRISQVLWHGVLDDMPPPTSRATVEVAVSSALNRLWQAMTADAGRAATYFELEPLLLRSNAGSAVQAEIQLRMDGLAAWHKTAPPRLLRAQAPELVYALTFGPTLAILSDWALRRRAIGDMTLPTQCWKVAAAAMQ